MTAFFDPIPAYRPQQVGVLLLPEFSNLTLASIVEPLRAANRAAGRPVYSHRLLSEHGGAVASSSGLEVACADIGAERGSLDLLLVVARYNVRLHAGPKLLGWLRHAGRQARVAGGMESGPYILARAGLLEGYRATTHWEDLEDFAGRFPDVTVANERFVVDRDRVTTGGAIPTLDLMLTMIRHHLGLMTALEIGSTFIYEQDSAPAEMQHAVSLGTLRWMEPKLSAAVDLMESNLGQPLPIGEIARRTGLGERRLQRLFQKRLGQTPQRVYLSIRLNAARRLLAQTELPIPEVADACGFNSRVAFHRAFRQAFDQAPRAYRDTV